MEIDEKTARKHPPQSIKTLSEIAQVALGGDPSYMDEDTFRWILVAVDLCSDLETTRNVKRSLQLGKISTKEAAELIMKSWHKNQNKTLDNLQGILLFNGFTSVDEFLNPQPGESNKRKKLKRSASPLGSPVSSSSDSSSSDEWSSEKEENSSCDDEDMKVSSQEEALSNSVILKTIFENLPLKDRERFRCVNSFWRDETLSCWRKSAFVIIEIDERPSRSMYAEKSMETFLKLCEPFASKPSSTSMTFPDALSKLQHFSTYGRDFERMLYKPQEIPFRRFKLISQPLYEKPDPFAQIHINKFWSIFGTFITHLHLTNFTSIVQPRSRQSCLKKILLKICPNLVEFEFCDTTSDYEYDRYETNIFGDEEEEEEEDEVENKVAESLKTFKFHTNHPIGGNFLSDILNLCPKLKNLDLFGESNIEFLLAPTSKIELNTLKLKYKGTAINEDGNHASFLVKKYVQLSAKITHLEIKGASLDQERQTMDLYSAVALCSQQLKTLVLEMSYTEQEMNWFMDLSAYNFPTLKNLSLTFNRLQDDMEGTSIKFDFGALKRMPMLNTLKVSVGYQKIVSDSADQWIYQGRKDIYVHPDHLDFSHNAFKNSNGEGDILCKNLNKFYFNGCRLKKEHVCMISKWFPNLTWLCAPIAGNAFPELPKRWNKLEELNLLPQSSLIHSQLDELKKANDTLKIWIVDFQGHMKMWVTT